MLHCLTDFEVLITQGSFNYPFGGIKQCKCIVILKDFPYNSAWSLGWCPIMTPVKTYFLKQLFFSKLTPFNFDRYLDVGENLQESMLSGIIWDPVKILRTWLFWDGEEVSLSKIKWPPTGGSKGHELNHLDVDFSIFCSFQPVIRPSSTATTAKWRWGWKTSSFSLAHQIFWLKVLGEGGSYTLEN